MQLRGFGSRFRCAGLLAGYPCGGGHDLDSTKGVGAAAVRKVLEKPRLAYHQLFVTLDKDVKFAFSQDSVPTISCQVGDQLTLAPDAAFTIGELI
jgi:hypothetical protein